MSAIEKGNQAWQKLVDHHADRANASEARLAKLVDALEEIECHYDSGFAHDIATEALAQTPQQARAELARLQADSAKLERVRELVREDAAVSPSSIRYRHIRAILGEQT